MLRLITFNTIVTFFNSQGDTQSGICPNNERWVDCKLGYCGLQQCHQLGYPIACPGIAGPCDGGCICTDGYLRDNYGICIPTSQCASCRGDFNATSGDGLYCGNLCSNYFEDRLNFKGCLNQSPVYNSCKCKEGFVFNDVTGQCVEPMDCPKACNGDYYAVQQSCPSECQPTCARPTFEFCILSCRKNECICVSGYILDMDDGKCIKIKDCPDDLGCNGDPNAVITTCVPCTPTCEQITNQSGPVACAAVCTMGCTCKTGYISSEREKKCILKTQCGNPT